MIENNRDNDQKQDVSGLPDEPIFEPGSPNNTYLPPLPQEGEEDAYEEQKSPFRRIWDRYSYSAVRIYLTQFAIGLFGASLAMATAKDMGPLFLATGIFSTLFFAVLLHTVVWNVGSSDRISVDGGRRKKNLLTGVLLGLAAGIPNLLLGLLYSVTFLGGAHGIAAVTKVVMMFSEGMYWSFICYFEIGGQPLHSFFWIYFVMAAVTVLMVSASYVMGFYNVGLPKALTSRGEEAERAEREKRQKPKKKL